MPGDRAGLLVDPGRGTGCGGAVTTVPRQRSWWWLLVASSCTWMVLLVDWESSGTYCSLDNAWYYMHLLFKYTPSIPVYLDTMYFKIKL